MKKTGIFKIITGIAIVAFVGLISYELSAKNNNASMFSQSVDVDITIDKDTSDSDLKDIKNMLAEHNISVEFLSIARNDLGELTGIRIELEDQNGNKTASQISGNRPIGEIRFGRIDGDLFINQGDQSMTMYNFFNGPNRIPFGNSNDSLWSTMPRSFVFNFDDFFKNDSSFNFSGQFNNIAALRDRMRALMEGEDDPFMEQEWKFDSSEAGQKFYFRDDPNINRLIIIDGEESTFKQLNTLAEEDQLDSVDILKSKTAMSIYGEKAKDGAIIATTKQ